jgi:quercetin dioxygenase-like cupin family protein
MPVFDNATIPTLQLPGLRHQTLASLDHEVRSMEVWMQTIEPGGATPVHRHACEEVIVVLSGSGRLTVDGETREFGPNSTIIVPPDAIHQIINSGSDPMFVVAALGMGPVRVRTAEGDPLPVPWEVSREP